MPPLRSDADTKKDDIVIIGAGVFGLTTALELRKRGFQSVTVLDRYAPPVPDGSSVDISRVIRFDYGDPVYARMALDAMKEWEGPYGAHFHRSGFLMVSDDPASSYIKATKAVLRDLGQPFDELPDEASIQEHFPEVGSENGTLHGFSNPRGGWANAEGAMRQLAIQCSMAGVSFVTGPRGTVLSLGTSSGEVTELRVAQGPPLRPSRVILATGAWSGRLIETGGATMATAQPIASILLTSEEISILRDMPICINVASGFFLFPPNGDGLLKIVRHGYGYETDVRVTAGLGGGQRNTSSPILDHNGAEANFLPNDAEKALRQGLKVLFPKLADRPFVQRRLCWYTDTPKGDFIIDNHPELFNLFLATGGSGHAFKFLPVMGRHIVDCFEGVAAQELRQKWRFNPVGVSGFAGDGSRGGPPRRRLTKVEQAKL